LPSRDRGEGLATRSAGACAACRAFGEISGLRQNASQLELYGLANFLIFLDLLRRQFSAEQLFIDEDGYFSV